MAITVVELVSRTSSEDTEKGRQYVHTYRVITTAGESEDDIFGDTRLPALYSRYGNGTLNCRSSRNTGEPADGVYEITLTYDTSNWVGQSDNPDQPWKLPAKVRWNGELVEQAFEWSYGIGDTRDNPTCAVVNSVRDPFSPPPISTRARSIIALTKNYKDFDLSWLSKYRDTVNSMPVTIGGVAIITGDGWMKTLDAELEHTADGTPYFVVSAEIVVDLWSHRRNILNCGFWQWVGGDDDDKRPIMAHDISTTIVPRSAEDVQVSAPQLLDATTGALLGPAANPQFIEFTEKWELDWAPLRLPTRKDGKD